METKVIKLKNGTKVNLNISSQDDVYRIKAVVGWNSVGSCDFNIVLKYVLDASAFGSDELPPLAKKLSKEGLKVSPSRLSGYKMENGKIKLGGMYLSYCETIVELNKIQVSDEQYGHIGLGHAMLKECENIAKQHKASRIEANYYPFGALKLSTRDFYERNGFTWDKNHISKDLTYKAPKK